MTLVSSRHYSAAAATLTTDRGIPSLGALLRRRALLVIFKFAENVEPIVKLLEKYSDVSMSLADACLVCMTETLANPVVPDEGSGFPNLPLSQAAGDSARNAR